MKKTAKPSTVKMELFFRADSSKLLPFGIIKLFLCVFILLSTVFRPYTRRRRLPIFPSPFGPGRCNISDYGQSFPKDPITVAIQGLCGFRFRFGGSRTLLCLTGFMCAKPARPYCRKTRPETQHAAASLNPKQKAVL